MVRKFICNDMTYLVCATFYREFIACSINDCKKVWSRSNTQVVLDTSERTTDAKFFGSLCIGIKKSTPFLRDLRYSTFCVSYITAKIWLDTILYHDIHSKNNVSLFIEKSSCS